MDEHDPVVFVIDDDEAVRSSLKWLIGSVGLRVEVFESARAFLDACGDGDACRRGRPGCLVTDVRMPGVSGLDLHREIRARGGDIPVIVITGHGDVQMAVQAMKEGAFDFIEKPFNDQTLLDVIQKAVDGSLSHAARLAEMEVAVERLQRLTPRERQVLGMVIAGEANKGIAHELGISLKTVEAHRAKVMEKMEARSLAELMKTVLVLEDYQGKP